MAIGIVREFVRGKRGPRVCVGPDASTAVQSKVERITATRKASVERESKLARAAWGITVPKSRILRQIHWPYQINRQFRPSRSATALDTV